MWLKLRLSLLGLNANAVLREKSSSEFFQRIFHIFFFFWMERKNLSVAKWSFAESFFALLWCQSNCFHFTPLIRKLATAGGVAISRNKRLKMEKLFWNEKKIPVMDGTFNNITFFIILNYNIIISFAISKGSNSNVCCITLVIIKSSLFNINSMNFVVIMSSM